MPVSNMENNNHRDDIEKTTKQILENLKQVEAVTVDHSNYRNGGAAKNLQYEFDEKENE